MIRFLCTVAIAAVGYYYLADMAREINLQRAEIASETAFHMRHASN